MRIQRYFVHVPGARDQGGAAMPEILYDRVIKFSPRPQTQQ